MNIALGASRRRVLVLLGVLLCAAWAYVALPGRLAAQDKQDKKPPAPAAGAAKPDADAKKPAAEPEKPAAAGETAPAAEAEPKQTVETESTLAWVVKWSGWIGAVLLLLSIYFVSTVARLFWEMRLEVAAPPETVAQCESLLERRDFKGIYALVKEDDSFFGRLLTTGIADLPNGLAEARDSMERTGETITAEMEKKISMLAVLGTLGPMIGLLGTLKGMIGAFGQIGKTVGEREHSRSGQPALRVAVDHVRGRVALGAGHLFLRPVPQSSDPHLHVGHAQRRSVPPPLLPCRQGQGLGRRAAAEADELARGAHGSTNVAGSQGRPESDAHVGHGVPTRHFLCDGDDVQVGRDRFQSEPAGGRVRPAR